MYELTLLLLALYGLCCLQEAAGLAMYAWRAQLMLLLLLLRSSS